MSLLWLGLIMSANPSIRIGNYFVFAPNGVAFVANDHAGFVLDPGGDYFAGKSSSDNAYHQTSIGVNGAKVEFVWSRVGDGISGRFISDKDVVLPLKLSQPWPGWNSVFSPGGKGWKGVAEGAPEWTLKSEPGLMGQDPEKLTVNLTAGKPWRVVAGFGGLPKLDTVDKTLAHEDTLWEGRRPKASGDWGDFVGAICSNLGNSRIYSNDDHRVAISVSRRWAEKVNSNPYFCWDSFFNGALACLDDPVTARETVRAILSWQSPEGLVPNFGHWNFNGRASMDRSQPPVGSMCVWKMHQRWPDKGFLEEVYPKLLKWHRWWPTERDAKHDGLLEWGSSAAGKQGALWETGWDDTPEFEEAEMSGHTLNAYAVDLSSMWAMDADYLATIADFLGKKDDADDLRSERKRTLALINQKLWNPELGIYCSRLWDGKFLTRLTPMNFYPLLAGAADEERTKQVLKVVQDPARFWGEWVLPTVAIDDPYYPKQDYWRGKVWAPTNFLVWQGLLQSADSSLLSEYADKSVKLFMRNWEARGVCGENYLSTTGEQSSDPHYTWGALLCLIGIESICRINRDGSITLDGTGSRTIEMSNIPIHGKLYGVRCTPGLTELLSGSHVVASAHGKVISIRM